MTVTAETISEAQLRELMDAARGVDWETFRIAQTALEDDRGLDVQRNADAVLRENVRRRRLHLVQPLLGDRDDLVDGVGHHEVLIVDVGHKDRLPVRDVPRGHPHSSR